MISGESSIKRINVDFPSALVPRWGQYCGPGWSAGQANADMTIEELRQGLVQQVKNLNGEIVDSILDAACKEHDISYALAKGRPDESIRVAQADIEFLSTLGKSYSSLTAVEKPYAAMAIAAFEAKLVFDGLSIISDEIQSQIKAIVEEYLEKTSGIEPFFLIQRGPSTHSITTNAEGDLIVSEENNGELVNLTLGKEAQDIEFLSWQVDESGDLVDSIQIKKSIGSSSAELTRFDQSGERMTGIIIGSVTEEKLDQFDEFALLSRQISGAIEASLPEELAIDAVDQNLAPVIDFEMALGGLQALDAWFDNLDPILNEPFLWEKVDSSLENFWNFGNDETFAAFDLGGVIDDMSWRPDFWADDWTSPSINPWVSDFSADTDFFIPDPLFDFGILGGQSEPVMPSFTSAPDPWGSSISFPDWSFSFIDPLVLKIGGGQVHTTNRAASTVMFDMNGDGEKEKTGWITADHAFLVRDKNNNGQVDDITEMFSERMSATAHTGFGALAELDTKRNSRIDKNDKAFADLRLWTDINANGTTESGELHKLARFGIQSIDLKQVQDRNQYDNGNMVLSSASYTASRGGRSYTGEVAEVLFNYGEHAPVTNIFISDQATALRTADGRVIEVLRDDRAQKVNASMSGVNILIGEKGDVLSAGNAGQSLLIGNGGAILNGNAGAVHFIVNGSQNIVNTGTGHSVVDVQGDANTVNAAKGTVEVAVDGSRNTISIGDGATVSLGGSSNTLTVAQKSKGNQINIQGSNQVVSASNAAIDIEAHASVKLNGKTNAITMQGDATLTGKASGGTLTVLGEGNIATLADAFVAVTEGSALTLTGGKQQVVLAGDASLTMTSNAKGSTIHVFGQNNQLTASKATIQLDEGAGLALNGSGSKITLTGDADFTGSGAGHVVEVYGTDNQVNVSQSNIYEHARADVVLTGLGNKLKVTQENSLAVRQEIQVLGQTERTLQQAWDRYQQMADARLDKDEAVPVIAEPLAKLIGVNVTNEVIAP